MAHRKGAGSDKIHLVSNVMIDGLVRLLPHAEARWQSVRTGVQQKAPAWAGEQFVLVVTLHRQSNVDGPKVLQCLIRSLNIIAEMAPILVPIHPRTRQCLQHLEVPLRNTGLHIVEPIGYLNFLALQRHETLSLPCLTVHAYTELPITITIATNILVGQDMERVTQEVLRFLDGSKQSTVPLWWDVQSGQPVASIIVCV